MLRKLRYTHPLLTHSLSQHIPSHHSLIVSRNPLPFSQVADAARATLGLDIAACVITSRPVGVTVAVSQASGAVTQRTLSIRYLFHLVTMKYPYQHSLSTYPPNTLSQSIHSLNTSSFYQHPLLLSGASWGSIEDTETLVEGARALVER